MVGAFVVIFMLFVLPPMIKTVFYVCYYIVICVAESVTDLNDWRKRKCG